MSTLSNTQTTPDYYDEDYYEFGPMSGKSCYSYYRWMPEMTCRMAMSIIEYAGIERNHIVLDYGCAKGFLVRALRLLFRDAYGCDVSSYAVSHADPDVAKFVRHYDVNAPLPFDMQFDFCISKDVFEHIPYEEILPTLEMLQKKCTYILCIIPLGDGNKYIIPAYEDDKSHYIREDISWWLATLEKAGYLPVKWDYFVQGIKDSWHTVHPEGNAVILAKRA